MTALNIGLGDGGTFTMFSSEVCQTAVLRAIREYSRYRPLLRRMGMGTLVGQTPAGVLSLLVAGGPFSAGDALTLKAGTPGSEVVTVQSVSTAGANATQDT